MAHSEKPTFTGHADRMIKVCGMADPQSIRDVAALTPMLMGFIFYAPSPRNALSLDPKIVRALPPHITPVGVFVNEREDVIREKCSTYGIDTVQLHGDESPQFCRNLSSGGLHVLKAFAVGEKPDWERMGEYAGAVEMLVLDTKGATRGGTGVSWDWSVLDDYPLGIPYMLSGGIGPGDESKVIDAMRPMMAGVDVNSRFELAPGRKNAIALSTFIAKLRNFNEHEPSSKPFWKESL